MANRTDSTWGELRGVLAHAWGARGMVRARRGTCDACGRISKSSCRPRPGRPTSLAASSRWHPSLWRTGASPGPAGRAHVSMPGSALCNERRKACPKRRHVLKLAHPPLAARELEHGKQRKRQLQALRYECGRVREHVPSLPPCARMSAPAARSATRPANSACPAPTAPR